MSEPTKTPEQKPTQPTITSANLPKDPADPIRPVTALNDESIVAKPLVDADFTKLRPRNPMVSFFFGNRVANKASGGDGQTGLRIDDLLARGFEFATPGDVLMPDGKGSWKPLPPESALVRNNRVVRGDLILLKIARADYVGATKYNAENAANRVARASNARRATSELSDALKGEGVSLKPQHRGKISFYNPGSGDRDNINNG